MDAGEPAAASGIDLLIFQRRTKGWSEPSRQRRAKLSSGLHNMAQRKSEPWPLTRPVRQLRRPPESYSRQLRMPSKRDALKSRNRLPASKRRLDVPQSARLAGAAVQRVDTNALQDGQSRVEERREKGRHRNARQSAALDSFMPQTSAQRLQTGRRPRSVCRLQEKHAWRQHPANLTLREMRGRKKDFSMSQAAPGRISAT